MYAEEIYYAAQAEKMAVEEEKTAGPEKKRRRNREPRRGEAASSPEEMRKTFCGSECLLLCFFSIYSYRKLYQMDRNYIERKEEGYMEKKYIYIYK